MLAWKQMEAVKGAVLALLTDCFDQEKVGVVSFWGVRAEVLLEPTDDVAAAARRLPTGGQTPLEHAFVLTKDIVLRVRRR